MKCKECTHFRGDQCYVNFGCIHEDDEACSLFDSAADNKKREEDNKKRKEEDTKRKIEERIEAEMESYFDGDYMDSGVVKGYFRDLIRFGMKLKEEK